MSKHTQGPWVLKHISGNNFAVQRFEIRSGSGMPYPIFNKDTNAIDGTSVCMSPHDARLIAASPDLLEALEDLVKINDDHNLAVEAICGRPLGRKDSYLDAARAAIARAKGEQP